MAKSDPQWRRALKAHENLHLDHAWSAQTLTEQARLVRWTSNTEWICQRCSAVLSLLRDALEHSCRPGHVPDLATARKRRKKKGGDPLTPQPEIPDMPELTPQPEIPDVPGEQYEALALEFNRNNAMTSKLAGVHVASVLNSGRLFTDSSAEPAVGDCFWWPRRHRSIACIVKVDGSKAHVVEFRPRPLKTDSVCTLHPQGGGCWRARFPIVSQEVCLPESFTKDMQLVPRVHEQEHDGGKHDGGMKTAWTRCFQLARPVNRVPARASAQVQETLCFLEEAASALDRLTSGEDLEGATMIESTWGRVAAVYKSVTTSALDFTAAPVTCPKASQEGGACHVKKNGPRTGPLWVSSRGCRRLICQRYWCEQHKARWQAPQGESSIDCPIVGDVLGKYLVSGDYWPEAWRIFQDTESFRARERSLRCRTVATIACDMECRPEKAQLTEAERLLLHRALWKFCDKSPDYKVIKQWLKIWTARILIPQAMPLSEQLCSSHAAVLNIDFSASDARQLRTVGARSQKRTW